MNTSTNDTTFAIADYMSREEELHSEFLDERGESLSSLEKFNIQYDALLEQQAFQRKISNERDDNFFKEMKEKSLVNLANIEIAANASEAEHDEFLERLDAIDAETNQKTFDKDLLLEVPL